MVRETDELREPLEFRFLVDLARRELESWEVRGFEECWGLPCARGEDLSEDALGGFFSLSSPPFCLKSFPRMEKGEENKRNRSLHQMKTYVATNWYREFPFFIVHFSRWKGFSRIRRGDARHSQGSGVGVCGCGGVGGGEGRIRPVQLEPASKVTESISACVVGCLDQAIPELSRIPTRTKEVGEDGESGRW